MLGCAGSPDDLRQCERLWFPISLALRMSTSPSWAEHAALEGETLQHVAAMRAWAAASRAYMMVRRGAGVALRDAVAAAVDHARLRIPANVGVVGPVLSRARARTSMIFRHFSVGA